MRKNANLIFKGILVNVTPNKIRRALTYLVSNVILLQWPGKKASTPSGWAIPVQINMYLWLGVLQDKAHYVDTLPKGYELSSELKNADRPRSNAPSTIYYAEKHVRFSRSVLKI